MLPAYHPIFVHFPIALITLAVIFDVAAYFSRNERLRAAGWWALLGGAIGGIASVATGLWDMYVIPINAEAHAYVDFHMKVGYTILATAAILTLWRGVMHYKNQSISFAYLFSAVLVLLLVSFQNWVGGELVYAYGVGTAPSGQSRIAADEAKSSLKKVDALFGPFEVSHEHPDKDAEHDHDVR